MTDTHAPSKVLLFSVIYQTECTRYSFPWPEGLNCTLSYSYVSRSPYCTYFSPNVIPSMANGVLQFVILIPTSRTFVGLGSLYSIQWAPNILAINPYRSAASSICGQQQQQLILTCYKDNPTIPNVVGSEFITIFCVGRPAPCPALHSIRAIIGFVWGLLSMLVTRTYCMV